MGIARQKSLPLDLPITLWFDHYTTYVAHQVYIMVLRFMLYIHDHSIKVCYNIGVSFVV